MTASIGSGGSITDDVEMARWMDGVQRRLSRGAWQTDLQRYYSGSLSYAELRARYPEHWAHCKAGELS